MVSSSASVIDLDVEDSAPEAFLFLVAVIFLGAGEGLEERGTKGKSDSGTGLIMMIRFD